MLQGSGSKSVSANKWLFDTSRHFKIWFSPDPNEFLDFENQLLFIRAVTKNPTAKFTLIYSSKLLNENAQQCLLEFSKKYNISLQDFDNDILPLAENENDKKLYELAKLEIEHAVKNQGGNLAAASDLVRVIIPVLEKCGIYSDFDRDVFSHPEGKLVECHASVLYTVVRTEKSTNLNISNDRIALACDREDQLKLSKDAVLQLRKIQHKLVENYKCPRDVLLIKKHKYSLFDEYPIFTSITMEYFKKNLKQTHLNLKNL